MAEELADTVDRQPETHAKLASHLQNPPQLVILLFHLVAHDLLTTARLSQPRPLIILQQQFAGDEGCLAAS